MQALGALLCLLALGTTTGCGACGKPASADLPKGTVKVLVEQQLVSVTAHEAPRQHVLAELAQRAGFVLTQQEPLAGSVTLDLKSVTPTDVLASILAAVPYAVHFAGEAGKPASFPVKVSTGEATPYAAEATDDEGAPRVVVAARVGRPELDSPQAEQRAGSPASEHFPPSRIQALEADDPELRAHAIRQTPPVGTGRAQLQAALAKDPDPAVRSQAAKQLGGSEDYASTHALLQAIGDPESRVALAAIDALVDKGDPSVCATLRAALNEDPEEAVESALRKAIGSLEYSARQLPESPDVVEYQPLPKGTPLANDQGDEPSASARK